MKMVQKNALVAALVGMVSLPAWSAPAQAAAPLTVNGQAIDPALVSMLESSNTPPGKAPSPQLDAAVKNELVNRTLLSQEAIRKGYDRDPAVIRQLALDREQVLARAYLDQYLKANPVSDAAARAEYDRVKAQLGDREYHISQIFVKTPKEAQEVMAKLHHGVAFDRAARQYSADTVTKAKGGDLGWVNPRLMIPALAEAVPKLGKGKLTQTPVASQAGYHIIKMLDSRPVKMLPFEEVKPRIVHGLQQAEVSKLMGDLRKQAKITGL